MRRIALLPAKDMDRRDYELIKRLDMLSTQSQASFRQIELGNSPGGGGQPLNDHGLLTGLADDDHENYFYLPGRVGGQEGFGSITPASAINQWSVEGPFVSESQKAVPLSSWPIAIDTSAEVGETVIVHVVTPPYAAGVNGTTSNHTALTDTGVGNTFTKIAERTYSDAFLNGCCHSIWYSTLTVALIAGSDQLTATFNASANAMAAVGHRFSVATGTIVHSATASVGEEGFVGDEPSALVISGLTPGIQYLFFRATGKGQAGSTVIGTYFPSTGYTALDHNGSITAGGTNNVGATGEYAIGVLVGSNTDPQLGSAGGHFSSMMIALAAVPPADGYLLLAAQDTLLSAKIEMIDSDLYLYGDTFNFRDAGGTTNVLTLRGSDGFFVDGIATDDLDITASFDLTTAPSQSVITEIVTLTGTGAGAGGVIKGYDLTVSGGSGLTSGSYSFTGLGITVNTVVPSGVSGAITGLSFLANASGAGALTLVGGTYACFGSPTPGSTAGSITALEVSLNVLGTTTTTARGLFVNGLSGTWTGATTSAIAIDVSGTFANDADVVTWYGLRISTGITAAIANKWSLSLTNTSTNMGSRVSHPTAVGWTPSTVSAITARLMLAAGTTAASSAPLKLQSGTSMTTAEVGALEYTTDDLFFTISTGTARKRLLFADPSGGLTSGRVPFATTNGRLTDDADLTFDGSTLTVSGGATLTDANVVCADGDVVTYEDSVVTV